MIANQELEFKFSLRGEELAAFRRLPLLREKCVAGPTRRKMLNVYFDTPGCRLAQQRMALRLRKTSGKWLQTLKAPGSSAEGILARGEWEHAVQGPVPDLSLLRETPLGKIAHRRNLHTELQAVFQTDFYRTAWLLELAPGRRVEVALDLGEIRCGEHSAAICEVEIELVEGDAVAVFEIATLLAAGLPLQPALLSKAERGYRLLTQQAPTPRRAQAVEIKRKFSPERASQAMLSECLVHFEANVDGALEREDPEYLHQLRVALRRMRSALRVLPPVGAGGFIDDIERLAATLGAARDWDIFLDRSLPALAAGYADPALTRKLRVAARLRRRKTRDAARAALRSPRRVRMALTIARWLHVPGALIVQFGDAVPADLEVPVIAAREIRRRQRHLLRDAAPLHSQTPQQQHRVRIEARRLRYTLEFFGSLYRKDREVRYARVLGNIQDRLGDSHDDAIALTLLANLNAPPALLSFARGWVAARAQANAAGLDKEWDELKKLGRKRPVKASRDPV